uniref:Uncharacterized protein n=1 Tax=Dasya binghamiae TaxID=1896963 RepID=A0A1C8XRX2_9FLOR|nr:hypothetical protein BI108_pgp171 [Dasya binghamiae]AOH77236.1 hypothetical protein [Dasya binghamiae]
MNNYTYKQIKENNCAYSLKMKKIDKSNIIKICNTMNIFHIGRTLKKMEYENSKADNYLKATISNSLNQTDFRYYMEILFQYIDQVKKFSDMSLAQNKFLTININLIFKNLNMSNGGKSYYHFQKSLNKLSDVTLNYDKKITLDGLCSIHKESLISYRILYKNSRKIGKNDALNSWRKLAIKMHPIILDMYKDATYNYSLFNQNSYNKIVSDKLKLLYYYFCCLTVPEGHLITLTINDLLLLWPKSNLRQLISQRKQEIVQLLKDFVNLNSELDDLDINLNYQKSEIIGIKIKKCQLRLI